MHACRKLKPCLLLSNRCHVRSCSVSFAKSRALFVVLEGNLRSGLTLVGLVHTVSRVSQEPWTGYGYDQETSSLLTLSELQPERLSQATLVELCKTRGTGTLILTVYQRRH